MRRIHRLCLAAALCTAPIACTVGALPGAPSLTAPVSVPPVATQSAGVWDSRDELAAWVNNGATTGAARLIGDGVDAAIQIDLSLGGALLHGPDLRAGERPLTAARLRYRWLDRVSPDVLFVTIYLRPPGEVYQDVQIPKLFADLPHPSALNIGDWIDEHFADHNVNRTRPPYDPVFTTILVGGSTSSTAPKSIRGIVEIDRIELIRPS